MATDEVGLVNDALVSILGAAPITALADTTARAMAANRAYPIARDELLASHPWNFAIKRATLATTTAPVYGASFAYGLPTDCLRVVDTDLDGTWTSSVWSAWPEVWPRSWQIEARTLVTDEGAVNIRYIAKITDVTKFAPYFARALTFDLAARLAFAVSQNAELAQAIRETAEKEAKKARAYDGQEGTPRQTTCTTFTSDVR